MEFLKNKFDLDITISKLDTSKTLFTSMQKQISTHDHTNYTYYLLYTLLKSPNQDCIDNLLLTTQDNLLSFIDILKRIVKSKFMYLNCQVNIILIVNLLDKSVSNKEILDTLVINCLRYASYSNVISGLDVSSDFLIYFKKSDSRNMYNVFGKDYDFANAYESILNNKADFSQYCAFPTQKQFLVTKICPNLEFNLIFYLERVTKHYEIYEKWLFKFYITDSETAKNVIRYLVAVYFTQNRHNLIRLTHLIFHKHKSENTFIAIFYDAFLFCYGETINTFLVELIIDDMHNYNIFYPFFNKILSNIAVNKKFISFLKASKMEVNQIMEHYNLSRISEMENIVYAMEMMNFDSFFELISKMEQTNKPYIKYEFYDKLIEMSVNWDGYMQVFMWKILAHQKIHFGFMPQEKIVQTTEAYDGYKILKYLQSKES